MSRQHPLECLGSAVALPGRGEAVRAGIVIVTVSEILDWNGRPLEVVWSRGGVMAICDIRRALLHDGSWPSPALRRKLKRSAQLRAFDARGVELLVEASGSYCDLQSINSEDAMTWSFFGPFLDAQNEARARLMNWLLELSGATDVDNRECEIHLWKRLAHPDTGKTSHGPEPDFALFGVGALVLGEAKWTAREGDRSVRSPATTDLGRRIKGTRAKRVRRARPQAGRRRGAEGCEPCWRKP